ncbi:hypothetical protein GCM10029978_067890 [Actinoallomurus acanthiterrae]
MLTLWDERRRIYPDAHDAIENVLMLAGRNTDVDELNAAARAIRRSTGEIATGEVSFDLAAGGQISFAVGDIVLIRRNEYRAWQSKGTHSDVLNGYRGLVTAVDRLRGVEVEWRQTGNDGSEKLIREWVTPAYISIGSLTYGAAMTVHKTQGLTADYALIYGAHLLTNAVYTALSRDRREAHLFLPRSEVEAQSQISALGLPRTNQERLDRVLNAFCRKLEAAGSEGLIVEELGERIAPLDEACLSPVDEASAAAPPHADVVRQVFGEAAPLILTDPTWPHLAQALDTAKTTGFDLGHVLAHAAQVHDAGPSDALASALADQVTAWLGTVTDPARGLAPASDVTADESHAPVWEFPDSPGLIITQTEHDAASAQAARAAARPAPNRTSARRAGSGPTRPLRHLTDRQINAMAAGLNNGLQRTFPVLREVVDRSERQTAAATASQGPSVIAVARAFDRLKQQAEAISEVDRAEDALADAIAAERDLREKLAELEADLASPVPNRRSSTHLSDAASEAERIRGRIKSSGRLIAELSTRRTRLQQVAGPVQSYASVLESWARRQDQQPRLLETARRTDLADAQRARSQAEELVASVAEMAGQLVVVSQEQRLRTVATRGANAHRRPSGHERVSAEIGGGRSYGVEGNAPPAVRGTRLPGSHR